MPFQLIDSLATTEPLAGLFSDEAVLQALLDFEAALARAEARLGVIPRSAVEAIEKLAVAGGFDIPALARETQRAGTPGIPVARALTERVRSIDPHAAAYVHWGATSQDVSDTALILLLKRARAILAADHKRLIDALHRLSDQHADAIMIGRTLLQPAPPVTFGLKAAGWMAAARRGWLRIDTRFAEAEVLQFGGAAGTLAALGGQGIAVGLALAEELGLRYPEAPWHTHRDCLAALCAACGVQCGTLGKIARDISLLMQYEVAEASEPGGNGRGGSSTMPHKTNPIGCSLALASAHRAPGLVAAFLSAMVQEHERGVGGWQAEWPVISSLVQATGLAVLSMAEVAEGLAVDPGRMLANLTATRGVVFAERILLILSPALGRGVAHQLLETSARKSAAEKRPLVEILAEMPEITRVIPEATLRQLDTPGDYLGMAGEFRMRLISEK